ncbi:helix-turn-helix domain-containing protein [Ramlibacter solisilvae]|uniref:MerR family transcriptional regulator n=1 Tax=Ramlibacter tataouinensis TaxID=94132 RepID=A0A127JPM2_9BURK|nr:helix-turn-helix domain-containing protein [Ramlibacter tataouinensis]AMO21984.1 MerR family transcriptional regulator [Ramlibacter tataouinensis]
MDIAEVAKRSGVPASALRFYEEKGLIASTGRAGLRRTFAAGVLDRLSLIALGRAAGFSLDEIKGMFAADGRANIDRRALAGKADDIDATIRRLQALSSGLRHAAVCPAPNHSECPTFKRLLRAAGAGKLSVPAKKPAGPRRPAG